YKITKSSYSRLIGATFECVIINKIVNKPPIWFQEFEKRNNARFDRIETRLSENDARWAKQEEFNKYVGDFIKQQVEFNKHVTDFIKHVTDVFERNNLK
ncbi:MAG: hypothetical protein LBG49_02430, partial [Mycoplasmataceae bacterium]|nr:hypothetical protein [Mycoplasmataceae bacterium]